MMISWVWNELKAIKTGQDNGLIVFWFL